MDHDEPYQDFLKKIDSVYFFAWPGFADELRSNRWHFSKMWSAFKPVVVLQPDRSQFERHTIEAHGHLPNVQVAHIMGNDSPPLALRSLNAGYGSIQARQVTRVQDALGHSRPLFWAYNPHLLYSYAALPAAGRVYHATENYFDFDTMGQNFHDVLRGMIRSSCLTVTCSTGVDAGIERAVGSIPRYQFSNGCDFEFFSKPVSPGGTLETRIARLRRERPIAVFAGNINSRLDFDLLLDVADRLPIHLLMIGPVDPKLPPATSSTWQTLISRRNVTHIERVAVEVLPWIYSQSRIGLIPYLSLPLIVKNGFPLKALEMAASGTSVVSTWMAPLQDISDAIMLVRTQHEFLSACRQCIDGDAPLDRSRVDAICREFAYEPRFPSLLQAVANASAASRPRRVTPDQIGYPQVTTLSEVSGRTLGLAKRMVPVRLRERLVNLFGSR